MLKFFHGPSLTSVTKLQFSDILRSLCDLQEKCQRSRECNFSAYFQAISKKGGVFSPDDTASFRKLWDDFREKGGYRSNTAFLNQTSNFPNGFVAHRKMLLLPTG